MLKLLLDEHISLDAAVGLRRRDEALSVLSLVEWESGSFLGQDDATCLLAARAEDLTVITYDLRTIPVLLKAWTEEGRPHAGVIFVNEKTISPSDIGGLARALSSLAKEAGRWKWQDRICFLRRGGS
jgi:hypothetical protein